MTKCLVMVYINADDVLVNFAIDSLNQLRQAAGPNVEVKALFNPSGRVGPASYYAFNDPGASSAPLKSTFPAGSNPEASDPFGSVDMTDVETLKTFVNEACGEPDEWVNRRHCLIFWGHGTELLLDREPDGTSRYLTPAKLQEALTNTKLAQKSRSLDIVAFDACNMSMIELATELHACADFMIASQEEVPDASFPYLDLLPLLHKNAIEICKTVPDVYKQSFQDYQITPGNGMKQITLSSLNLAYVSTITQLLKTLSGALLSSIADQDLVNAIIAARGASRDFVLGIFVDLSDFCEKLEVGLQAGSLTKTIGGERLAGACKALRNAINNNAGVDAFVIANQTGKNEAGGGDGNCHGISIYFPYSAEEDGMAQSVRLLGKDQTGVVSIPLVEGSVLGDQNKGGVGHNANKGGVGHNANKGGRSNQNKSAVIEARIQRIQELESDFADLSPLFQDTGWRDFTKQWSVILAKKYLEDLDLHYSLQQCVKNLLSMLPGPPAAPANSLSILKKSTAAHARKGPKRKK